MGLTVLFKVDDDNDSNSLSPGSLSYLIYRRDCGSIPIQVSGSWLPVRFLHVGPRGYTACSSNYAHA